MSQPARFGQAVRAQATMEARLTARRGENLLAMIGLPAAACSSSDWSGPRLGGMRQSCCRPCLHRDRRAWSSLGIATAYERGYGVLKRLGGSPLGREGLLVAKLAVVASIAVAQVVFSPALAWVMLGWRPGPDAPPSAWSWRSA